ncbi:MAG: hypothetical protein HQL73_10240 [Magnetococcales bacterium]|nr:hypothetical protein [Magnetococcales bacterium]
MLHEATPRALEALEIVGQAVGTEYSRDMAQLRERVNDFLFDEALVIVDELAKKAGLRHGKGVS